MSKRTASDSLGSESESMASRVRHCVVCPKCGMRYLVGFSPYQNGSYLVPLARGLQEEWTLYCACATPHNRSQWSWEELKACEVPNEAHHRGYGTPEEIFELRWRERYSG